MENGKQAATKQDLSELEQRLRTDMESMGQKLRTDMDSMEQRLVEAIRDSETKLLKAFYAFAEGNQKHLADLDRSDSSLRERMSTLEARITAVEKRLNMPPGP